jgi:NADH-quinone oxidoreductase subunit C
LSKFALDKVSERFPQAFAERYTDRAQGDWAVVQPGAIRDVLAHLKDNPELDFKLFCSMDAVDRLMLPTHKPRFEVVYFLYSIRRNEHVRLKVRVDEGEEIPSAVSVFQGANWWERLIYDFYGVRFTGHPDLRRILLYEEFKGHPLRKDYPLRQRQPLIPEKPIQDIFRGPGTNGAA